MDKRIRALNGKSSPEDVELIIVATATPDAFFPSTACKVQSKIENKGAVAFDISAACSGFIYALYVADSIMRSKNVRRAVVVGAERFSRIVNWKDRTTCILFGDGAGAVLLENSDDEGVLGFDIGADGSYGELLAVPSVGSNEEYLFYNKLLL
jgi:3-oxoacyl-[acyl-carrier-protein] synthase-3